MGRLALRDTAHLGDALADLGPGQVSAGTGLGRLARLEMKGLYFFPDGVVITELCRTQFEQIAAIGLLLLGQHTALPRANTGADLLGTTRQCQSRFLRQGTETHVGNQ